MPVDTPSRGRLTRDDWITAALGALSRGGPDAVAIEPVAAALGTTKGSGYWHFANRTALVEATMDAWLSARTGKVIEQVDSIGGSAVERLGRLLALVSTAVERAPGEAMIMSSTDPVVRQRMQAAVEQRVAYVAALLVERGLSRAAARSRAVLAYATFSGHAMLAATIPDLLPHTDQGRRRMHRHMLEMVIGPDFD